MADVPEEAPLALEPVAIEEPAPAEPISIENEIVAASEVIEPTEPSFTEP